MRRRAGAAALAIVLLAGLAAGGFIALQSRRAGPENYRVSLGVVAPSLTDWWGPGESCPANGRGDGPPRELTPNAAAGAARADPVGRGQVLVYELVVQSAIGAPGVADLTTTVEFDQPAKAPNFDPAGVLCAFVDDADPVTTSRSAKASVTQEAEQVGEDSVLRVDVRVAQLEAESSALVQLWIRAADEVSRSSSALASRITAVTAPAGNGAAVLQSTTRLARPTTSTRSSLDLELALDTEVAPPAPGGSIGYVLRWTNPGDFLVDQAVIRVDPDPVIAIQDIDVRDSKGQPTSCAREGASFTCTAPYLVAGEEVKVWFSGAVAPDAPTLFGKAGNVCAQQGQDLCSRATVVSLGGAANSSDGAALATDLPSKENLGLAKLASGDPAALYVGRQADFSYVLVGGARPVSKVVVDDPSCAPLTLVGGDQLDDKVLGPGERWIYQCSEIVDRSQQVDVTVTAVAQSGEAVGTIARLGTPVLDPGVEVRTPDDRKSPSLEVTNSGDTSLYSVVVSGRGCAMTSVEGDANTDGVLDAGERWVVPCEKRTGAVRAYAVDKVGGAVTAGLAE